MGFYSSGYHASNYYASLYYGPSVDGDDILSNIFRPIFSNIFVDIME